MFNNLPPIYKRLMNQSFKIDENVLNQFSFSSIAYNIEAMESQTQLNSLIEVNYEKLDIGVYKY
jgi:hypothetical protein